MLVLLGQEACTFSHGQGKIMLRVISFKRNNNIPANFSDFLLLTCMGT